MAKLVTLRATYRIVTPMFLGGAEPNDCAELRPPSIKGALRFWYRAIDPYYRQNEARIFGGTGKGEGQAMFLLRVSGPREGKETWKKDRYGGFGTGDKNGIRYLSYSLALKPNDRKAVPADSEFTLSFIFRPDSDRPEDRKRPLAALWLLGHIGGLGSRSRRGFGTVALKSWNLPDSSHWQEINGLPLAHEASDADGWLRQFEAGLAKLNEWFPSIHADANPSHTMLRRARFFLIQSSQVGGQKNWCDTSGHTRSEKYTPWEAALNEAGKLLQDYRYKRTVGVSSSDYERVKKHLEVGAVQVLEKTGGTSIIRAAAGVALSGCSPERCAFGLPLTFRYNSFKVQLTDWNGKSRKSADNTDKFETPYATFAGNKHDRSSSPLFIRVVEINGKCHPLFGLLNAPLLASNENVTDGKIGGAGWAAPGRRTLDDFCDKKLKPIVVKEVIW